MIWASTVSVYTRAGKGCVRVLKSGVYTPSRHGEQRKDTECIWIEIVTSGVLKHLADASNGGAGGWSYVKAGAEKQLNPNPTLSAHAGGGRAPPLWLASFTTEAYCGISALGSHFEGGMEGRLP